MLLTMLIGAGLMWFYDPVSGTQRREALQRKLNRGNSGGPVTPPVRLATVEPDRTVPTAATH